MRRSVRELGGRIRTETGDRVGLGIPHRSMVPGVIAIVIVLAVAGYAFSAIRPVTLDGAPGRSVDYRNALGQRAIHYTALRSRYAGALPAMQQVLAAWRSK